MRLVAGAKVGPFEILAELGARGMGVVYRAYDRRLDRQVAIKVLARDRIRDDTAKQRFLQEAKAASALDHPNICTIYDVGETPEGQLYLVMAGCIIAGQAADEQSQPPSWFTFPQADPVRGGLLI